MSVLDKPANELLGVSMHVAVLTLWQNRANAGTIMSLCHIGEDELETMLPRAMWLGHRHTKCTKCDGAGRHAHEVKWEEDDYYYPAIEAAKRNTLSWATVVDWVRP